jgi:Fic family protein
MVAPAILAKISATRAVYETLIPGKSDLLRILTESELPEAVYNSNAIENSTLTLEETERILLAVEVSRHMDLREVHEAQNLGRVSEYINSRSGDPLSIDLILLLHKMLLSNINDDIAGRFRGHGEYVRVGTHVAPGPEQIETMLRSMTVKFESELTTHIVGRVARLHLEFEHIHPFNDGNGRIGRVLMNHALQRHGFPPVIVRNKGKEKYYATIRQYDLNNKSTLFEGHLALLILESLHRRIAYLRGAQISNVTDVARTIGLKPNVLLNQSRRQVIPAFRERGVWKIPNDYQPASTDHTYT